MDGRVMPWLQEAMQTVTMLESRLQELEDCKAIPLYERDRLEMIQVIQELDAIVQQDQGWIDHVETAIQWITDVLENALISSTTGPTHERRYNNSRDRTRTHSQDHGCMSGDNNRDSNDLCALPPGLERNTRSEGMLPSLVPVGSKVLSLLPSLPLLPGSLESNVDPFQINDTVGSSESSEYTPLPSAQSVYRNAITVALRHLRTIEPAPPLPSSRSGGSSSSSSQEQEGINSAKKWGRVTRKAPDGALKEWLDNSSMMGLASNVISEGTDEDVGDEADSHYSSRVLSSVGDMSNNSRTGEMDV
ncbi:hypothetical protein BGX23_008066 [Mortierella sp. AD031]|nr:hypothetical protein BGX23_008066 [Mortierella sp. AD031]KAG0208425.1 hypothetical protein BGX33_006253 [Mortierella sp. NVP41]